MQQIAGAAHLKFIRHFFVLFSFLLCCPAARAATSENVWGSAVQFTGNRVGYSSPVIAEVDGNASNGKEVVAASTDGIVAAFSSSGSLLWEQSAPDSGCGGRSQINSSPAVGTLYGDGIPYVVVGYGGFSKRCEGGVMAIRGTDGAVAWVFSTKAWAKKRRFWAVLNAVFSSPAVADTDGDGKMEIGFGSFDRYVYLLNYDGSVRWYYTAADTVWSSPTFADLNGDGKLEMILGTDISQNKQLRPATKNGGNLYAFKTDKNPKLVYGFRDKRAYLWMKPVEQTLFSSPRVGEVIPENPGPEVVINSGCYFPERTNNKVGKWSRVFSGRTGKLLRTLSIQACSSSSPALADVTGDGALDVFVTVNGAGAVGGDGQSHIEAFDARNSVKLWDIVPYFKGRNYAYGGNFISPLVRDVDQNGTLELVTSVATGVGIYDAVTGGAVSCESGTCGDSIALSTRDVLINTPAIGDLDDDGNVDIVAAGKGPDNGSGVYRWEISPE